MHIARDHKPKAMIPSFHDGYLKSIAVERGKATLGLTCVNGEAFELRLDGVEALQADDFRLGNIISSLEVRGSEPARIDLSERLERLFPSPHQKAEALYHERYSEFIRGVLARIADGTAAMVIIESSYGCDFVAVCCDIKLTRFGS